MPATRQHVGPVQSQLRRSYQIDRLRNRALVMGGAQVEVIRQLGRYPEQAMPLA